MPEGPYATAPAPAPARIVIIDDNRDLALNLAEILEGRGLAATTAGLASEGLARVAELRPEVCVIDLNLPDMHGLEVLDVVRSRHPETQCVMLTGYASLESAVAAVNRGAFAYGIKGLRLDNVLTSIERAVERVRTRRALGEERALLTAVIDRAPLGLIVLDRAGRILRRNRRVDALLASGDGEGAQGAARAADLVERGVGETDRRALAAVLAGDLESAEVDVESACEGRRRLSLAGARVPLRPQREPGAGDDAAGERSLTVVSLRDVTDERALQRGAERASRLAAIGELSARIAHEIRNPLAGIAQAVRVLARGFEDDPARGELARVLRQQIGRLNSFIEDLLVLARPARLRRQRIAVADAIGPTMQALAQHPAAKGARLAFEDEDGGEVEVDARLLAMVVDNLVINAAQMPGTRHVTVRALGADDGALVVRCEDDGPGIADDVMPLLFEPFETTRVEGTGLGLSTTKRIVEAHGGTITAGNRPEGGAVFEVRLPRRAPDGAAGAPAAPASPSGSAGALAPGPAPATA